MAVSVLTNITNDVRAGKFTATVTAAATAGASSVFCGFTPSKVTLQQTGGTPDATWFSQWIKGMTAGYQVAVGNTGAGTIATTNGITVFDGSEADRTDQATNSPLSGGQGFLLGSGTVANNIVYHVVAER